MLRAPMMAAALGAVLALASASFAQQGAFGTADEAKAMLMKAVAAIKLPSSRAASDAAVDDLLARRRIRPLVRPYPLVSAVSQA